MTKSKELVFYSWKPLSPEASTFSPYTHAQHHTRTSRTFCTFAVTKPLKYPFSASPDHSISLLIWSYLTLRNRCTKSTVINFHQNNTCPCYGKCFSNLCPSRDANFVTTAGWRTSNTQFTFMLAGVGSGLCTCRVVTATRSVMVMNTTSTLWVGTH